MKFKEPKESPNFNTPIFQTLHKIEGDAIQMKRMLQKVIETVTVHGTLGPNEIEPWAKELAEEIASLLNELRG